LKFGASLFNNSQKYVQVPKDKDELAALKERLRRRFPVDAYNKARKELDPNKILSNNMLEKLFPLSETN
jgi:L-galactono-1,4-lactone dehydrogenase